MSGEKNGRTPPNNNAPDCGSRTFSYYYRVENADVIGFNGFHVCRDGRDIIGNTLADLFDKAYEARIFARQCKEKFPDAIVVVVCVKWFVHDSGAVQVESTKEIWRGE